MRKILQQDEIVKSNSNTVSLAKKIQIKLLILNQRIGAGSGNRTRIISLEG
ncbi:hypothetical protein JZN58_000395 [Vibrio vulnificus]|nr:hypothetical protein [Vibrio vulnificus]